ncbi:MAG: TonB-dependent receptor [Acidobacteria bacterium]|nr:TonB-dependent receptor [Acidobacteriota bacterium]
MTKHRAIRDISMIAIFSLSAITALVGSPADQQRTRKVDPNRIEISAEELTRGLYGLDLFDVLAALAVQPGITVKSSSDLGAEDWLLIRGYPRDSARNVVVLIDGTPLNDGLSGANEFEHLPPVELIEKIIIYKPPLPARFGAAHAAIEIITKQQMEDDHSELVAGYGGYTSALGTIWSEGQKAKFSYFGVVDYLRTANLSGVRRTPPRDSLVYGDRSFRIVKPAAKFIFQLPGNSQLSTLLQFVDSHKFYSDVIFRGEREYRDRALSIINVGYRWSGANDSHLSAAAFRTDERYQMNLSMHPSVRDQKRVVQGGKADASLALPGHQILSAGANFSAFSAQEKQGAPLHIGTVRTAALYVEDEIHFSENLSLVPGLRYDDHSEAKARFSPVLGARYHPGKAVTLHGNWGRSVRWPGLAEFDSEQPDSRLQGEELSGFDAGASLTAAGGRLSADLSYFRLALKNEAKYMGHQADGRSVFHYVNLPDQAISQGVEADLKFVLSSRWLGFFNYTFNRVRRAPGDTPIDYGGPQNLFNAGIVFQDTRFSAQWVLRSAGAAQGVQMEGGRPTQLEGWTILDAAASVRLVGHAGLFARVSNVFNTTYETFDGRPMFGRMAVVGLRLRF